MNGERHLASHVFNVIVLVVGAGALVLLVHRLGLANARRVFGDVGWWFAVILALDLASTACDAGAIHAFMRPEARMVSYARVFAAQASGRAINILTPGGALGEATKVTMLVSHAPRARVVSSIVLYNLATFYLSVAVVLVGVPLTAALVDLPSQLEVVVWTGFGVLVALVIAIGVIIHRGALATVLSAARGLRFVSRERVQAWEAKLLDIDRHLRELHASFSGPLAGERGSMTRGRSPGTRAGLAMVVASRLCAWAATTVVMHVVGVPIHASLLVGVLSVGVLIGWISNLVPLGLGVADGSNYALFDVLGASGGYGVFVTLLGRARSLTLAVIGLVVMAAGHTANRVTLARRNRRMAAISANHRPTS